MDAEGQSSASFYAISYRGLERPRGAWNQLPADTGPSGVSLNSTGWAVRDFRFLFSSYVFAVITYDSGLLPSPASPHESHLLKDLMVRYSFAPVNCLAFYLIGASRKDTEFFSNSLCQL